MANEVGITVTGRDVSGSSTLQGAERQATRTRESIEGVAAATDELDTTSAGATSALGALASGFELVGSSGGVEYLGKAALATDFFAGVGEASTLVLSKFGGTFTGLKDSIKGYVADMRDSTTQTGKYTKAIAAATVAIGVAIGAAQAAGAAFGSELNAQVEELSVNLEEFARSNKVAGEASRLFGKDLENLSYDLGTLDSDFWTKSGNAIAGFVESITGLGSTSEQSLERARERLKAYDDALARLVEGGKADLAEQAFARMAETAKESGVSVDELKKGLPEYTAAQAKAARATQSTANATEDQVVQLSELADHLAAAADPMFALIDAQQELDDAQRNYNAAIKEHGRKSPEAQAALRDMAKAAISVQGATVNAANTFNGRLDPALRNTLRIAGLTAGQIDNIERQFREARSRGDAFAKTYSATVKIHGPLDEFRRLQQGGEYVAGRASGGPAGGMTLVGENGPELLRLPQGSQVMPSANAAYMGMGADSGGVLAIEIVGTSDPLMRALIEQLRFRISRYGAGSVQQFLGTGA